MKLETVVSTLKSLLPEEVRVVGSRSKTESEPVEWDAYGNVTAVEYTSTPFVGKTFLFFYWDEPSGIVGIQNEVSNRLLKELTLSGVEALSRIVVNTIEKRRQNGQ